jgi:predicted HicB family RNase H-like nuclease
MKYKGYTGVVEFDEESGSLYGRVIGLRDVITFQGESVAEVTQAFRDSVDDYLEFCAKRGRAPDKPYSGQFVLRIDPGLHRALSHAAEEKGQSLTSLVEETLAARFLGPAANQGHRPGPAAVAARRCQSRRPSAVTDRASQSGRPASAPREPEAGPGRACRPAGDGERQRPAPGRPRSLRAGRSGVAGGAAVALRRPRAGRPRNGSTTPRPAGGPGAGGGPDPI